MAPMTRAARGKNIVKERSSRLAAQAPLTRGKNILGARTKTAEKNVRSRRLAARGLATLAEVQSILSMMERQPVGEGSSG